MAILKVDNISKNFGGLTALNSLSFEIAPNSIHGLIGPNGSGKTTFFNIVTGFYRATAGNILFCDEPLNRLKPFEINARGIARTFQHIGLFKEMTVLENVMVGRHCRTKADLFGSILKWPAVKREEIQIRRKAMEILELVTTGKGDINENGLAGNLSYGRQRLLEIARALASEPKLVLLDEPAAGMNPTEKEELTQIIYQMHDSGITVLFVEHDMKLAMTIADRITVLDHGTKIAEGTAKEVQSNPQVMEAYLGMRKGHA
jgi:branched-chain amino acid transport system ATP-binding protein